MPPSPTLSAPADYEQLQTLLKDDIKVKVAGPPSAYYHRSQLIIDCFTGVDVDGVLRGKIMSKSKFLSAVKHDGFGFCSIVFGWDREVSSYG